MKQFLHALASFCLLIIFVVFSFIFFSNQVQASTNCSKVKVLFGQWKSHQMGLPLRAQHAWALKERRLVRDIFVATGCKVKKQRRVRRPSGGSGTVTPASTSVNWKCSGVSKNTTTIKEDGTFRGTITPLPRRGRYRKAKRCFTAWDPVTRSVVAIRVIGCWRSRGRIGGGIWNLVLSTRFNICTKNFGKYTKLMAYKNANSQEPDTPLSKYTAKHLHAEINPKGIFCYQGFRRLRGARGVCVKRRRRR
jgi:hypothetical protein